MSARPSPVIPGATEVSLTLPEDLSFEDWRNIGAQIGRATSWVNWAIGDWWAYGEQRYGERKAVVEAEDWDGPGFGACANAATVCRAFEPSRRREALSFKHHAVVASLPPVEADALLDWCVESVGGRRSTRELRGRIRELEVDREVRVTRIDPGSVISPPTPISQFYPAKRLAQSDSEAPTALDDSSVGGPVPPELANLTIEAFEAFCDSLPPEERVPPELLTLFLKAAYNSLPPEERLGVVSDLAAELGYVLTPRPENRA